VILRRIPARAAKEPASLTAFRAITIIAVLGNITFPYLASFSASFPFRSCKPMSIPRVFVFLCLSLAAALSASQTPPTSYAITEAIAGAGPGATTTVYRSGSKVLTESNIPTQGATPASKNRTLYDIQAKASVSWDPSTNPPACGDAGTFSGDWGDPFGMTAELQSDIAKGDLRAPGTETLAGVSTQIYSGTSGQSTIKAWLDQKDGLVIRAIMSAPGTPAMTLVDISKVSFGAQPASLFALPPACAGVKPQPSAADTIADETGDDPANFVNGMYGPGSKNMCSVVLRVVNAKTMTPISKIQMAIDTAIYPDNAPPSYTFGVADDGTTTYSGGHVLEITNRVHNGVVRLGNPPDHFQLGVNVIQPHHGGSIGLVYRQCFGPTTVLLDVVKDYGRSGQCADFLWVKAGKFAAPPAL
jgi:hypothetical protein